MKAEIYYFSSTGNTLLLARDGAERLKAQLIPLSSLQSLHFISSQADIIGFYFPVYHATFNEPGIPYFIRDIIKSFRGLRDKYVFAVCAHNGMPAFTLDNLDRLLKEKGAFLAGGMDVKMGIPYGTKEKTAHLLADQPLTFDREAEAVQRESLINQYRARAERSGFYERIHRRETCRLWKRTALSRLLLGGILKVQRKPALDRYRELAHFGGDDFRELTRFADRSFTLSGDCNGCGVCERICPVHNIEISRDVPHWQHRCENCFACFQWCPVEAIGGRVTEYEKRFHQPALTLKDILNDDSV